MKLILIHRFNVDCNDATNFYSLNEKIGVSDAVIGEESSARNQSQPQRSSTTKPSAITNQIGQNLNGNVQQSDQISQTGKFNEGTPTAQIKQGIDEYDETDGRLSEGSNVPSTQPKLKDEPPSTYNQDSNTPKTKKTDLGSEQNGSLESNERFAEGELESGNKGSSPTLNTTPKGNNNNLVQHRFLQ